MQWQREILVQKANGDGYSIQLERRPNSVLPTNAGKSTNFDLIVKTDAKTQQNEKSSNRVDPVKSLSVQPWIPVPSRTKKVLTVEEKMRIREESLQKLEELQLEQCTFRPKFCSNSFSMATKAKSHQVSRETSTSPECTDDGVWPSSPRPSNLRSASFSSRVHGFGKPSSTYQLSVSDLTLHQEYRDLLAQDNLPKISDPQAQCQGLNKQMEDGTKEGMSLWPGRRGRAIS